MSVRILLPLMAFMALTGAVSLASAKPPLPNSHLNGLTVWTDSDGDLIKAQKVPGIPCYVNDDDDEGNVTNSPTCPEFHSFRPLEVLYDTDCSALQLYECRPSAAFAAGRQQGAAEVLDLLVPRTNIGNTDNADGVEAGRQEVQDQFDEEFADFWLFRLHQNTAYGFIAIIGLGGLIALSRSRRRKP